MKCGMAWLCGSCSGLCGVELLEGSDCCTPAPPAQVCAHPSCSLAAPALGCSVELSVGMGGGVSPCAAET